MNENVNLNIGVVVGVGISSKNDGKVTEWTIKIPNGVDRREVFGRLVTITIPELDLEGDENE